MPFVFKFSVILIVAALVGGQFWQLGEVDAGVEARAAAVRLECPAIGGPAAIVSKGDQARFYDAYARRLVGGALGLSGGCEGA